MTKKKKKKPDPSAWVYPDYHTQPQRGAVNRHLILWLALRKASQEADTARKWMKHAECRPSLTTNNNSCEGKKNVLTFPLSNGAVINRHNLNQWFRGCFSSSWRYPSDEGSASHRPHHGIKRKLNNDSQHWKGWLRSLTAESFSLVIKLSFDSLIILNLWWHEGTWAHWRNDKTMTLLMPRLLGACYLCEITTILRL